MPLMRLVRPVVAGLLAAVLVTTAGCPSTVEKPDAARPQAATPQAKTPQAATPQARTPQARGAAGFHAASGAERDGPTAAFGTETAARR